MTGGGEAVRRIPETTFTARDLRAEDLEECFSFAATHMGQELVGFSRALAVWKDLARSPAFRGEAIEGKPPVVDHGTVGFGARIFISRDFVDSEMANPRPGLYSRLVAGIENGEQIALTNAEIRRANADGGLDIVLIGGWRPRVLALKQVSEAHTLAALRFAEDHTGYQVNRLIAEVTSEAERRWRAAEGIWRVLSNFESFYAQNPGSPWPARSLVVCTREDALSVKGHSSFVLFQHRRPELRLREADQVFLEAALSGLTDEELAAKLNLGLATRLW